MTSQTNVVPFKLAAESVAEVVKSAKGFAQSEIMGALAVETLARVMTDKPTFLLWEAVRAEWIVDYKGAKACNDDAAGKAWQRMAARMEEAYGLIKPKAETPKATEIANKREKAKKEQEAVIVATCKKPLEQVTAQELLALQTGPGFSKLTPTNQNHIVAAYQSKRGEELAEHKKQAGAAEKAIREELAKSCKNMHGENLKVACETVKVLATWDAKRLAKVIAVLNKIK